MHKQWQWMCPIGQLPLAMWRQHAHVGSHEVANNPVACGAARGVERRRRAGLGCSAGGGERLPAGKLG